ncbi:MAG: hypothetical protein ACFFG0_00810 [Candidatus Thorarchaeota archaeon]
MSKKKYKILRVTYEKDYLVEMIDGERTIINGWTIKEVIDDWFGRYPLSSFHASREAHTIGNSEKFIDVNVIDGEEEGFK